MIDFEQEFEILSLAVLKAAIPNCLVERFYAEPSEEGFWEAVTGKIDVANRTAGATALKTGAILIQCQSGNAEGIDTQGKMYQNKTEFVVYCGSKVLKETQLKGGRQTLNLFAQVREAILNWNGVANFSDGQPINPEFTGWQRIVRSDTIEIVAVKFTFQYESTI